MYISSEYGEGKTLDMDIPNDNMLKDISIGDDVQVNITGKVKSLSAPYMHEDYDAPYVKGKKRPMKKQPGRMCIDIVEDPGVNAIREINNMLRAEDDGAND